MRIAITGQRGRVGKVFLSNPNVVPLECDILTPTEIQFAIKYTKPDLIVHMAAKSDVDFCELEKNHTFVSLTNLRGTYNVAAGGLKYGCNVVLISSDHVFSGKRWVGKYKENDTPDPVNYYGLSKMAAEKLTTMFDNLKVVRSSSLFDDAKIALERGKQGGEYPIFLKRSFTYLPHFSQMLYEYCQDFSKMPKVLHLAGIDSVSYYEFMCDVRDRLGIEMEVNPRRKELDGFAPRGHNLGLDVSLSAKLGFHRYSYLDGLMEMK